MIKLQHGNLLAAPAEALVNTVNTEGVMGKGIALQFRRAFPTVYEKYAAACRAGEVRLGQMYVVDLGGLVGGPRWIINFPTKGHWRSRSRLADIEAGLNDLIATVKRLKIGSIALPPLGCGHGGLDWEDVRPRIERAFSPLHEVNVLLYPPEGAPPAEEMSTRTDMPAMTLGRAALIGLMGRYQAGHLDPFVSLLELHKLMYFLQETGQPLRLKYESGTYGPYSENLRQVLIRLEGHWLRGYGDGADKPGKPMELLGDALQNAERFLADLPDVRARMDKVAELIEGYEDAQGLELLSSVHWIMKNNPEARKSADTAIAGVHSWNVRKRKLFKPDHLRGAWARLKDQGWDRQPVLV